jgi:NADPH:quinone reductase-like Zn-dependent oxidoreductase
MLRAVLADRGVTALRAARRAGARAGDRVLVTGATGALGALVVQIGKAWGWQVTAICPDREMPLAWDLGADDVHARERTSGPVGTFAAVIDVDAILAEPEAPASPGELAELSALVARGVLFPRDCGNHQREEVRDA